jgi:hypothetical protein
MPGRHIEELKLVNREERCREDRLRIWNIYNPKGLLDKPAAIEPDIAKAKKLAEAAKSGDGLAVTLAEFE